MLRGLHGRAALSEGKLVRCASGSVFEVILDLRPWSTTFLQWDTLVLDDVEHRQVWVPPGFVHGFQAVTAQADICYRMDAVHDPSLDIGLAWNDPDLGIEWPLPDPVLSDATRPHRRSPRSARTSSRGSARHRLLPETSRHSTHAQAGAVPSHYAHAPRCASGSTTWSRMRTWAEGSHWIRHDAREMRR